MNSLSSTLDTLSTDDAAQLPAPPSEISLPAVATKRRGRPASIKAPSLALFAHAANDVFTVTVDADHSGGFDVTVGTKEGDVMRVMYQGPSDRTLIPQLKGKRGFSDKVEGFTADHAALPMLRASIPADQLLPALDYVSLAMSQDVTRERLCGVYFDADGSLCATDGQRLHLFEGLPAVLAIGAFSSKGATVPAHAIRTLIKAIKATRASVVECGRDETCRDRAWFRVVGEALRIDYRVRMVDDQFPDYRQVIPSSDAAARFSCDAKAVRAAFKAAPVLGDRMTQRRLEWRDDGVTTFRHDGERVSVPMNGVGSVTATFTARYLDDAFEEMDGEVSVAAGELDPLVLRNGPRLALVMPCRM